MRQWRNSHDYAVTSAQSDKNVMLPASPAAGKYSINTRHTDSAARAAIRSLQWSGDGLSAPHRQISSLGNSEPSCNSGPGLACAQCKTIKAAVWALSRLQPTEWVFATTEATNEIQRWNELYATYTKETNIRSYVKPGARIFIQVLKKLFEEMQNF